MQRLLACLAMSGALVVPAFAQNLSPELSARAEASMRIGMELYAHDQSAWHVTDELMALRPDVANKRILYVTERVDEKRVKTTFVLMEDTTVSVFFSGVVEGAKVVSTEDFTRDPSPPAATANQAAQADALMAAREMFPIGLCGQRPNFVVLPSKTAGAFDVYALAPETQEDVVQLGGHERLTIDSNGLLVPGSVRAYSNSCAAFEAGSKAEALVITLPENIGDTPTEIHVFKSISHRIPIYVMTASGIWAVEGARIRLVDKSIADQ